jgi:hypothetical protein
MVANMTSTTPGSRRPNLKWLIDAARQLRAAGVQRVDLPGVSMVLYPEPSSNPQSSFETNEEPSQPDRTPYRASGLIPIDLVAQRAARGR